MNPTHPCGCVTPLTAFHKSHVQLPIPTERSLLDFLFTKQEVQCCADYVRAFSKQCCQIVLADHNISSWVATMDIATVAGDFVSEGSDLFFLGSLRTFFPYLLRLKAPSQRDGNTDNTSDRRSGFPVQGNQGKTSSD